jgi:hypothetical protein
MASALDALASQIVLPSAGQASQQCLRLSQHDYGMYTLMHVLVPDPAF